MDHASRVYPPLFCLVCVVCLGEGGALFASKGIAGFGGVWIWLRHNAVWRRWTVKGSGGSVP